MRWAERRKLTYSFSVLTVLAAVVFLIVRQSVIVEPTCTDGKKNGQEVGVDCGGSCLVYCPNELPDPKVRWVRTFPVTTSIVHAVASIEHGNPNAGVQQVGYKFKLYDERNTLIVERTGSTFIGPMGRAAIVDTLIPVGNTPATRVQFSFTEPVRWQKISSLFSTAVIKTDRTVLERFDGGTRLAVTLENQSRFNFKNTETIAILYDASGNAITASSAIVPEIQAQSEKVVYFTWPYPVTSTARIEVIPRINPFTAVSL